MGYTTEFEGEFRLSRPLTAQQACYLRAFADTRRMKRDEARAEAMDDPVRRAVGLPIGRDAAYFVGGLGFKGQDHDESVVDGNNPPFGQPGLWCQWEPDEEGRAILWNGAEKFYNYVEWLEYLIEHFLGPWGHSLNGLVTWQGEDEDDQGTIEVVSNRVSKGPWQGPCDPAYVVEE